MTELGTLQSFLRRLFNSARFYGRYRDFERDAMHADDSEKIFDDDDMWKVYDQQK